MKNQLLSVAPSVLNIQADQSHKIIANMSASVL